MTTTSLEVQAAGPAEAQHSRRPTSVDLRFPCPFLSCDFTSSTLPTTLRHITNHHTPLNEDIPEHWLKTVAMKDVCPKCRRFIPRSGWCIFCAHFPNPVPRPTRPRNPELNIDSAELQRLLGTNVHTLPHIPAKCRKAWATRFAELISAYLAVPTVHHLALLMLFPKATLCTRGIQGRHPDRAVSRRIAEFPSDPLIPEDLPGQETRPLSKEAKAAKQARQGALSKALRTLTDPELEPLPEPAAFEALLRLHPEQDTSPSDTSHDTSGFFQTPSPADVMKLLATFPPLSAGGPSGLKPAHLRDAVDNERDETPLSHALGKLLAALASGHLPRDHAQFWSAANIHPLPKRNGGVRPIAVSETIRRLTSKFAFALLRRPICEHLRPLQLGVGTRDPTPILHALLREQLRPSEEDEERSPAYLLNIDLTNAFNTISRTAVADAIGRSAAAPLRTWFAYTHGGPAPLFFRHRLLFATTGVQQGDPLSPAYFAMGLHPAISPLLRSLPLTRYYLDDGFPTGTAAALRDELPGLLARLAAINLQPNLQKSHTMSIDPEPLHASIPHRLWTDGTEVLGVPLGGAEHEANHLTSRVAKVQAALKCLGSMPDKHAAMVLAKSCVGTPSILHLLRCIPPSSTLQAATSLRDELASFVDGLIGTAPHTDALIQFHLPQSMGGFGVTNPTLMAAPAYLTTRISLAFFYPSTGPPLAKTSTVEALADVIETLGPHFPELLLPKSNDDKDWPRRFESIKPHQLRFWSKLAATRLQEEIFQRSPARERLRLHHLARANPANALSFPAPRGLNGKPVEALPPPSFAALLRFLLGVPFLQEHARCVRCNLPIDPMADHMVACSKQAQHTARHDTLRDAMLTIFKPGSAIAEQGPRTRPGDILIHATDAGGSPIAVDLTVVTLALFHGDHVYTSNPMSALQEKEREKIREHQEVCRTLGWEFLPAAFSVYGAPSPNATKFLGMTAVGPGRALRMAAASIYAFVAHALAKSGPLRRLAGDPDLLGRLTSIPADGGPSRQEPIAATNLHSTPLRGSDEDRSKRPADGREADAEPARKRPPAKQASQLPQSPTTPRTGHIGGLPAPADPGGGDSSNIVTI